MLGSYRTFLCNVLCDDNRSIVDDTGYDKKCFLFILLFSAVLLCAALGAWKSDLPVRFPGTECGALHCIDCAVIFSIIFAALYILINIHFVMFYCTLLCYITFDFI